MNKSFGEDYRLELNLAHKAQPEGFQCVPC
jgi:hypothetical protein